MNHLLPKILIFLTFFGSCIVIGLLLSALVTNCWISSEVSFLSGNTTTNTKNQFGHIQFGLYSYQKALNHGYGLRHANYSVVDIMKNEDNFMDYTLWMATVLGTGFALFASAIAAVASVIGTIKQRGGMVLMVVSNTAAGIGQLIAFFCWILQFFNHLRKNVLLKEEKKQWTSEGQATFGYSFFFIVAAFLVVALNLVLLTTAVRMQKGHRKSLEPIEEKEGNSIMLY